jgi:hypothetical protein
MDIKNSIVAILNTDNEIVGTGFWKNWTIETSACGTYNPVQYFYCASN